MNFSEAGKFPEDWPVEPLRRSLLSAADGPFGSSLTSSHYVDKGARVVRLGNLGIGKFKDQDKAYISLEHFETLKSHSIIGGDLLVAGLGDENNPLGRATLAPDRIQPAIVKADCFRLRLRPGRYDPRFVVWYLSSAPGLQQALLKSRGSTRQRMNVQDAQNLLIPRPPLNEQRRIADFLDAETARIDQLIDYRHKQLDVFDERYSSALAELVTPGVASSSNRSTAWPWLPEAIKMARLGYMARVQTGVTVHNGRGRSPEDVECPYLRVANVQGEELDLTEIKLITVPAEMARRSRLQPGDVVMTEANGNPNNLGRAAVWSGQIPGMIHQNHVFAVRVNRSRLVPEFLSALLASNHGRQYFLTTSSQVGIATTSSSKVLDFPIPILPLSEQHAISAQYRLARERFDRATGALRSQLALLSERRQALITTAVTGQLDVSTARGADLS